MSDSKNKNFPNAKAFLHYVFAEKGGVKEYNDEIGVQYILEYYRAKYGIELSPEYVAELVRKDSEEINKRLDKKIRKSRFKVYDSFR